MKKRKIRLKLRVEEENTQLEDRTGSLWKTDKNDRKRNGKSQKIVKIVKNSKNCRVLEHATGGVSKCPEKWTFGGHSKDIACLTPVRDRQDRH